MSAELEAELAELEPGDRQEMLDSLGLEEPAIGPLARGLNALLGLGHFYTAGDKEVRAWTIPLGATAPATCPRIGPASARLELDVGQGLHRFLDGFLGIGEVLELAGEVGVKGAHIDVPVT